MRCLDEGRQQDGLPDGGAVDLEEVGCGAHQEGPSVGAAEHAGEDPQAEGGEDLIEDLAALGDPGDAGTDGVRGPDAAVGVKGAAVGGEAELGECLRQRAELGRLGQLGPDAPVGERPVGWIVKAL